MSEKKLSFLGAVLININVVVGSAFFLGASSVAEQCGFFAPFAWLMCGLLLVPLIAALSYFARQYPDAGGLYWYSKRSLGNWWGFVCGWAYFIGTAAGNVAVLKAFSAYLETIHSIQPLLVFLNSNGINTDVFFILVFGLISCFDIVLLERLQLGFSILKLIPFFVLLVGAFFLADFQYPQHIVFSFANLWQTLPMVFFAYIGIEACSAVIDKINDPERNGFRVLSISFVAIALIYFFFQACVVFITPVSGINPFLSIIPRIFGQHWIATWANAIVLAAIVISFLGGFYGMFYFNNWNLHALAHDESIIGSSLLKKLNKQQSPWVCVLVQTFFLILLLFATRHSEYLITMSDFGVLLAYLLTTVSFLQSTKKVAAYFSFISCGLLLYFCTNSLITTSIWNIMPFLGMLGIGFCGYFLKNNINK